MKKYYFILSLLYFSQILYSQNKTNVSLFLRADSSQYIDVVSNISGDLFDELGHHGPAVENEWSAYRFYFDYRTSVDVYSKVKQQLELNQTKWYPTIEEQQNGWGADYYKVGTTVGLGGVRLWDGEKVVALSPVSNRIVKVKKERNSSYMEMLSKDIPYKDSMVDIIVRLTVYSGFREAKIEVFALSDKEVQFVTGINYHEGNQVFENINSIIVWGTHPEDIASETVKVGGAIMFDNNCFEKKIDDGSQKLLISKATKNLSFWITSASEKETELNNTSDFRDYVIGVSNGL